MKSKLSVLVLSCGLLASFGWADETSRLQLVEGVQSIPMPGIPGTLAIWGKDAFPVITGKVSGSNRLPVVGASVYGKGRVVVLGHDGYLEAEGQKADGQTLLSNILKWVTPANGRVLVVGGGIKIGEKGTIVKAIPDDLKPADALVLAPIVLNSLSKANIEKLQTFVNDGGGLVVAMTGWGWQDMNNDASLHDYVANHLLAPFGIAFSSEEVDADRDNQIKTDAEPGALLNANEALDILAAPVEPGELIRKGNDPARNRLEQAGQTVFSAAGVAPEDSDFMQRVRKIQQEQHADRVPTEKEPIRTDTPFARLAISTFSQQWKRLPAEKVTAHPASAIFPGSVAESAVKITRDVSIDLSIPRWHSTGLYAAPGQVITVKVPKNEKDLSVRIGSHKDKLFGLDLWKRMPDITQSWPIKDATIKVASPFGGLIYIEVPDNQTGKIAVTITGGVDAPLYVLGKTTPAQWEQMRKSGAPWGEFASDRLIITVPTSVLVGVDDPAPVMQHWNKVLDADYAFLGKAPQRKSPERIVDDVQISAGYMHSGYPIMTWMDVIHDIVDVQKLCTVKRGWGFYHELGHNHQNGMWTFAGTGEVTNNVFAMYVLETVCGLPPEEAHSRALGGKMPEKIAAYIANPDFEKWKSDPFLALSMYSMIRMEFGWKPFTQAFMSYDKLTDNQKPKSEIEKHDMWMVSISKATGRNLGPYFEAWGVPTSEQARDSIKNLPGWLPKGFPINVKRS